MAIWHYEASLLVLANYKCASSLDKMILNSARPNHIYSLPWVITFRVQLSILFPWDTRSSFLFSFYHNNSLLTSQVHKPKILSWPEKSTQTMSVITIDARPVPSSSGNDGQPKPKPPPTIDPG